jgi:predicted RND superfamily exporter protein
MNQFKDYCLNTPRINRFPVAKASFAKELLNWLLYNSNGTNFRTHVGFRNLTKDNADLAIASSNPKIAFIQAEFRSRVHPSMSASQQLEKWTDWEAWINQLKSEAPVGLQGVYQTTWQWSRAFMETSLISGLVGGLVLSAAVALGALLIMLGNIVTSLLATVIIVLNIVLVLGLFWLMGWNLGVIEAISVTVLVGLSDEYVFHLADAYTEVQEEDASALDSKRPIGERRFHLMREAMYRVGASVLSGASTTAIASAMLILTAIRIFFRFGIVVSINIAIALTLSVILFPCLMMFVTDPQH